MRIDGEIIGVGHVVVDITERKEAEEFRAVVMDNMAEGLYALDADGLVTYMNPAAASMLGWTEDELRGKPMHATVHFQRADGKKIPAEECSLLQVRTQGRTIRILDDAFTRKDGSIFPVAYSSAPLRSGATVQGVVVVFRDISEEKKEQAAAQRELDALMWLGRVRDAIDENRLVLYSQPIVPLADGRPSEELLLRMIGRDNEVILPGSFLPVAEKYGLIGEIDRWVITQATRLAATGGRVIEVNLSAASIGNSDLLALHRAADPGSARGPGQPRLRDHRDRAHARHRRRRSVRPRAGRTRLRAGPRRLRHRLRQLHLPQEAAHHPPQDRHRIRPRPGREPDNLHVVQAIVSLARAFGLNTIAEGVEDEEALTLLRAEGVDFAQGFHLGRPSPTSR